MDTFDILAIMNRPLEHPLFLVPFVFILGAMVGSLLNVCIYRMPLEKSLWWPGSRCGNCYQPVKKLDNLPLISYWRLGGECRTCGMQFSSRYFWIELFTALLFATTFFFYLNRMSFMGAPADSPYLRVPRVDLLLMWLYHITFLCFLIVAVFTDFDHREIPLRLTIPGTVIGILGGSFVGWPWPLNINDPAVQNHFMGGLHFWPFWAPLSDVSLPFIGVAQPNAWYVGFLTSVIGALVGTGMIRLLRSLFSWAYEKEAMGLGDADLLMMIGAFLGWQALILVLGYAIILGLLYVLVMLLFKGGSDLPFGPPLAGGAVLVLFDAFRLPEAIPMAGPVPLRILMGALQFTGIHYQTQSFFFNSFYVAAAVFFFIFMCFNACMIIRFLRVGFRPIAKRV